MERVVHYHQNKNLVYDHVVYREPRGFMPHTHNLYEILFILRGNVTHISENRKYSLTRYDLIFVPPSRNHFIKINAPGEYERYNMLFDAEALHISEAELDVTGEVFHLSDNRIIRELFQKMDYYVSHLETAELEEVMSLLLKELFFNLRTNGQIQPAKEDASLHPMLLAALKYINDHLFTVTDVSEIAGELFITESYLFKLFKNQLGTSPKRYIVENRLRAARDLIRTGQKPTDVYEKCGFSDYTVFYRNYVKFFGISPKEELSHVVLTWR